MGVLTLSKRGPDLRLITLIAAVAAAAASVQAAPRAAQVSADQAWSRPAAAGMTGAGFVTLTNRGKAPDMLVGVESAAARKAEIHRSSTAGGVARMQRLDQGLAIPAGGAVTLAPGGAHIMFVGLAKAAKTGDRIPATLVFRSGARLEVQFEVRLAAPAEAHHHH